MTDGGLRGLAVALIVAGLAACAQPAAAPLDEPGTFNRVLDGFPARVK